MPRQTLRNSTPRPRRANPAVHGSVIALVPARIERGLAQRQRYRYVQPRVEREGAGWKIVSPNCSRQIDRDGGDIDIAWFEPRADGRWALHSRDHERSAWRTAANDLALDEAIERVCSDPLGRFWP